MQAQGIQPIGLWEPENTPPVFSSNEIRMVAPAIRESLHIVYDPGGRRMGLGRSGHISAYTGTENGGYPLMSSLPALYPEWLGDRSFLETHGVRFPYIAGAMYRGIASPEMVIAMAKASMLAFLGTAGMSVDEARKNIDTIEAGLNGAALPWGSNLIYTPTEPGHEEAMVDLYLERGIRRISASAYMAMSPAIIRYAATGLRRDATGHIHRQNFVFAKISRSEVARPFMEPAPADILTHLVEAGQISQEEARLAAEVPVAEDITVESDSGGHTDNRPLTAVFPTVLLLRNEMMARHGYRRPIRVGAAGGMGTPASLAAAFSMGAAYVLTGSVNQSSVEAGMSPLAKEMLCQADVTDVTMAPAADMFELGVKVQVLKRGTMFSNRAANLYQIYSTNDSIDTIPEKTRTKLEKEVFRANLNEIWEDTRNYFLVRKPDEVEKAERDPKHLMALVFRWYLGQSANWAIIGDKKHKVDFQMSCGPSMGAFNNWVKGTFLAAPKSRSVVQIALNLLEGAALVTRSQQLRTYGLPVPDAAFDFRPRPLA